MWNKRNDDNRGSNWPAKPSAPETPVRNEPAIAREHFSDPPVQRSPAAETQRPAAIGTSMMIKGEIRSNEELYVDGEVEGTLELQNRLTVGPNGKIRANIKAREVVVLGTVKGNVEVTEKIAIRKNGSLVGDIRTAGIMIDDGAYFKGSIDIVKPEPARKPAPAPAVVNGQTPERQPSRQSQETPA